MKRKLALSAATALLFVAASAQAQRGGDDRRQDQRGQDQHGQDQRVSPEEQRRRIDEDRQRQAEYQQKLNEQIRAAQAHSAELQRQQRVAQYDAQEQYLRALQRQQEEQRALAARAYERDPYYTTPHNYRYRIGSIERETNQYGVDVLRQAVNLGYEQGYRTGLADRRDRAPADYRRAFAYQDANYGYNGSYVSQSDYNYYFREGFQRGYDDGYFSRSQYGTFSNGNASILGNIVAGILGLTSIR